MRRTMDKPEYGIVWHKQNRLTDLDFEDDIAMMAEEAKVCQEMTTKLEGHSAHHHHHHDAKTAEVRCDDSP